MLSITSRDTRVLLPLLCCCCCCIACRSHGSPSSVPLCDAPRVASRRVGGSFQNRIVQYCTLYRGCRSLAASRRVSSRFTSLPSSPSAPALLSSPLHIPSRASRRVVFRWRHCCSPLISSAPSRRAASLSSGRQPERPVRLIDSDSLLLLLLLPPPPLPPCVLCCAVALLPRVSARSTATGAAAGRHGFVAHACPNVVYTCLSILLPACTVLYCMYVQYSTVLVLVGCPVSKILVQ